MLNGQADSPRFGVRRRSVDTVGKSPGPHGRRRTAQQSPAAVMNVSDNIVKAKLDQCVGTLETHNQQITSLQKAQDALEHRLQVSENLTRSSE